MTFALLFACSTKRNSLIECYIISYNSSFTDDNTMSVVNK